MRPLSRESVVINDQLQIIKHTLSYKYIHCTLLQRCSADGICILCIDPRGQSVTFKSATGQMSVIRNSQVRGY